MITETCDAAQELDVRQRAAEGARLLLAALEDQKDNVAGVDKTT